MFLILEYYLQSDFPKNSRSSQQLPIELFCQGDLSVESTSLGKSRQTALNCQLSKYVIFIIYGNVAAVTLNNFKLRIKK